MRPSPLLTVLLLTAFVLQGTPARSQDLLVASRNSDRILRYDAVGNYAGVFASGNGLDEPACLGVGPDGAVYAGMRDSSGTRRVLKWDAAGAFQYGVSAPGLSNIAGIAADSQGAIFASSQMNGEVVKWNADRSYYNTFAYGSGLAQPAGMSFGPDGKLFVASSGSGQILVWRQDGTFDRVLRALGATKWRRVCADAACRWRHGRGSVLVNRGLQAFPRRRRCDGIPDGAGASSGG